MTANLDKLYAEYVKLKSIAKELTKIRKQLQSEVESGNDTLTNGDLLIPEKINVASYVVPQHVRTNITLVPLSARSAQNVHPTTPAD